MKPHLIAIAASALFASGIGVASAASSNTMSKTPPATQATQATAKDNLSLTLSQQRTAWRDISKQASAQVSSLKPYDYALLHNRLLIVNPNDKKIVDVIKHRA
jgi:Spy/CpxP family protein refolding chaperone